MENIGKNITYYRKQNGMSQNTLAEKLFVTPQAVSRWERNETEPSIDTIKKIAAIFNVTVEDLINDNQESGYRDLKDRLHNIYLISSLVMIVFSIYMIFDYALNISKNKLTIVFIVIALVYLIFLFICELVVKKKKRELKNKLETK